MSRDIVDQLPQHIKPLYDFIPFANWDDSEKGSRPAPYKLKQTYPDSHALWNKSEHDRVGVRLNNLVLVDYDGNKEGAVGEIPSPTELATALGYDDLQELYDQTLIQWNDEMTSLHFLFLAPSDFNVTDFKQSNQGTTEHFWKHIDIKTGNQLVYLKKSKTARLWDPQLYPPAPTIVMDQLRSTSTHVASADFDYSHNASDHQIKLAEEWLHEACSEMVNAEDGGRNAMLNTIACTVSGLVAGGSLDNQASYTLLFEAAIKAGLDRSETINTLASGWEEGFKTPRRDAPYVKSSQTASEVFATEVVHNTNVNVKADSELTSAVQDGGIDGSDPDIGILHAHYTYFRENWVMNSESRYVHIPTLASLTKTAFNVSYVSEMPVKPGSKLFKKFVPADVFEMCNPTVVADTMYMPGEERLFMYEGLTYLNSYIAYTPERPPVAELNRVKQVMFNHLHWLFADPNHQKYMMEWLAWNVQRPGEQVGWLPLLMGCRGDGKSILFELATAALGSRNTKLMSNKSMKSDFQSWAVGAAVTAFEEIKIESRDSKQVANDLKPFITESRITVNRKNKNEASVPNTANYIAFSNESDPISIASNDRRWMILETQHFGKNTVTERTQTDMKQHFDDIKDLVNHEEFHAAVHHVLLEHPISEDFINHRYRAPQTAFSAELTNQTASEKEQRLQEYLDNARFVDGRPGLIIDHVDGFQVQDFRPVMPDNWFSGMDKKPSAIMLGKWLRSLGYEVKNRVSTEGNQIKTFKRV